jgi:hypothetical protein
MERILKQLIQLQELNFTLLEQRTLVPKAQLVDLENAIKALMEDLPPETARLYRGLQKRYDAAVVPEAKGTCSACGISLPTSLLYANPVSLRGEAPTVKKGHREDRETEGRRSQVFFHGAHAPPDSG